jgi:hypothetical protein
MTSGLTLTPRISATSESLISFTVTDTKSTSAEKILNYPASQQGFASSVLIDNQDGSNSVTVRINRGINTITVPASGFRSFNGSWIEQINLTGASTDTQVTAQIVLRNNVGF